MIHLTTAQDESTGYGRMGLELRQAFAARGCSLAGPMPRFQDDRKLTAPVALWVTLPQHVEGWFKGQEACLFTMWETMSVPAVFRNGISNFDRLFVPSWHNVELFSRFHDDVTYVPLGINPETWYPVGRPVARDFTFLCAGSWKRKGADLAVRAFHKVFGKYSPTAPIPKLVLKTQKHEDLSGERISQVNGALTIGEEAALYASAHCYVGPSRGEGWGLMPLQAMAQGCPTILTAAHGHEAFCQYGLGISAKPVPANKDYFYKDAGDWWEPDFDELCEAMLHVYRNYDTELARAQENAVIIRQTFTWDATAERLMGELDTEGQAIKPGPWMDRRLEHFRCLVTRPWGCTIQGTAYRFEPGVEYWELPDVKRMMWEHQVLDPSCVDADEMGIPEEDVQERTGRAATCPTCGQKLNSNPAELVL